MTGHNTPDHQIWHKVQLDNCKLKNRNIYFLVQTTYQFVGKYLSFHKISIFSNRSPVGLYKQQLSRWYLIQQILIIAGILFYCYLSFLSCTMALSSNFDSILKKKGFQIQLLTKPELQKSYKINNVYMFSLLLSANMYSILIIPYFRE